MSHSITFTFDDPVDGKTYNLSVGSFDDQSIPFLAIFAEGVGDTTVARIELKDSVEIAKWIRREYGDKK